MLGTQQTDVENWTTSVRPMLPPLDKSDTSSERKLASLHVGVVVAAADAVSMDTSEAHCHTDVKAVREHGQWWSVLLRVSSCLELTINYMPFICATRYSE